MIPIRDAKEERYERQVGTIFSYDGARNKFKN